MRQVEIGEAFISIEKRTKRVLGSYNFVYCMLYEVITRLVLRINIADTTAQCPLAIKFGAEPGEHAEGLVRAATEHDVRLVGVSFHVGSGCRDATAYHRAIAYSRRLFDLGTQLGHDMTILDLGGGYPGSSYNFV